MIDRLHIDKILRVLCGWRYRTDIPSESKFSRVFKELSDLKIAEKTHEKFIKEYLSEELFFYNATHEVLKLYGKKVNYISINEAVLKVSSFSLIHQNSA